MVKKGIKIILLILIFISFFIILYGIYVIYFYDNKVKNMAIKVEEEIDNKVLVEKIDNQRIVESKVEENNADIVYEIDNGDALGIIVFESGKKVAIYNNPTDNNMMMGIGKIVDDSVLNESGNSVLVGHNDIGFSELKNIEVNDIIKVKTIYSEAEYQVVDAYVTESNDPNPYKYNEEVLLTLITCYPFNFFGNTSKRFVVIAKKIIEFK